MNCVVGGAAARKKSIFDLSQLAKLGPTPVGLGRLYLAGEPIPAGVRHTRTRDDDR